jgi:hypothetical protein
MPEPEALHLAQAPFHFLGPKPRCIERLAARQAAANQSDADTGPPCQPIPNLAAASIAKASGAAC